MARVIAPDIQGGLQFVQEALQGARTGERDVVREETLQIKKSELGKLLELAGEAITLQDTEFSCSPTEDEVELLRDMYYLVQDDIPEHLSKTLSQESEYVPNESDLTIPDDPISKAIDRQVGGDHYKDLAIQPMEFFQENEIPFIEASIMKYVIRHRDKNGLQDLDKAEHLIQVLKERDYPRKEE